MENPNIVYGRLTESVHISGYSLERALWEFEWLLKDDRWKSVGMGYNDINEFLKTISFSEFKIAIEQRKELSKKLAELQASQRTTAKMLGVNNATIHRDVAYATLEENITIDNEDVIEADVANATPSSNPGFAVSGQKEVQQQKRSEDKIEIRKQDIEKQKVEIAKIDLRVNGLFDLIIIDPPWNYGRDYDPEGSRVANPYPEMTFNELSKIKIPSEDNCILWLWTTHAFIWDAKKLMDLWGFEYKAILIWNKEKIGMGSWLRMQTEFCLLGIKGKPIWDVHDLRDIISEPRREHSRKPEAFYDMITKYFPGKRAEYFSREIRPGFEPIGNDINKF